MAGERIRVFLSYSRRDQDTVLRLQATLQTRGIDAWVDLRRLEGGQDFDREIEDAIRGADCTLVALSPDAVSSPLVRSEILFAQRLRKRVISLMLRETYVPVTLAAVNYVDFTGDFESAVAALQLALYAAEPPPAAAPDTPPSSAPAPATHDVSAALTQLVPPPAPLPAPDPNLDALYRAGVEAEAADDLERAAVLWGQILDRDPAFRNGQAREDMERLQPRLHASRVRNALERAMSLGMSRQWLPAALAWQELLDLEPGDPIAPMAVRGALREYAYESQRAGRWDDAIAGWNGLLKHLPDDAEARDHLAVARAQLEMLWQPDKAPYYGAPDGIAPKLGLTPPSYEEVRAEERRRVAAEQAARERDEQEQKEAERNRLALIEQARQGREDAVGERGHAVEALSKVNLPKLGNFYLSGHLIRAYDGSVGTGCFMWVLLFPLVGGFLLMGLLALAYDSARSGLASMLGPSINVPSVAEIGVAYFLAAAWILLAVVPLLLFSLRRSRQLARRKPLEAVVASLDKRIAALDQQIAALEGRQDQPSS